MPNIMVMLKGMVRLRQQAPGLVIAGAGFCLAALFFTFIGELSALPPPISMAVRVKEADIVILGTITRVSSRPLNSETRAADIRVRLDRVIKGEKPPADFSVAFIVFPGSWEDRLRGPPRPGIYYLFLQKVRVRDSKGKIGSAIVLYRPHPYSYEPYDEQNRKEMNRIIRKLRAKKK